MSSLDLQSGYWQIEVHEEDRNKTEFITSFEVYRFNRMAFGLCNVPSTFQRLTGFTASLHTVSLLTY